MEKNGGHATWSGGRLQDGWWKVATWSALHSRYDPGMKVLKTHREKGRREGQLGLTLGQCCPL